MKLSHCRLRILLTCLIFLFASAGCISRGKLTPTTRPITQPVQANTPTPAPSFTATRLPPASSTPTTSQPPTWTPSPTSTRTPTQTSTTAPIDTPIPTYTILRGEVLVHSACLYGPGAPYLYKYGLLPGSNLDIIGRNDLGTWILVQAIGGNNPCWLKASLMDIKGDVMTVAPTYIPLPQSPYYSPPRSVLATRDGNEVTVFWEPIILRPGDETASPLYLVEAWVCQAGQLIFIPIGSNETFVKIIDEPGCSEPSHGRVYGVEKHGYTKWLKVPWPPVG